MRPPVIVVIDPVRDFDAGVIKSEKQRFIEQLIPHSAIETLAEPILHRLPRRDEMAGDPMVLSP